MRRQLWIFGYGSLMWRPAFDYVERRPAVLRGWSRRFWQGSTDHRGTPAAPGRVVTLIATPDAACAGMVYRISSHNRAEILKSLDHREQGGYRRVWAEATTAAGAVTALIYFADPGNPNWLGPAPLADMAEQIFHSVGPSGANLDYLYRLAATLRDGGNTDDHVFALETAVRRRQALDGKTKPGSE